jgi:hypothetical protein
MYHTEGVVVWAVRTNVVLLGPLAEESAVVGTAAK